MEGDIGIKLKNKQLTINLKERCQRLQDVLRLNGVGSDTKDGGRSLILMVMNYVSSFTI